MSGKVYDLGDIEPGETETELTFPTADSATWQCDYVPLLSSASARHRMFGSPLGGDGSCRARTRYRACCSSRGYRRASRRIRH